MNCKKGLDYHISTTMPACMLPACARVLASFLSSYTLCSYTGIVVSFHSSSKRNLAPPPWRLHDPSRRSIP